MIPSSYLVTLISQILIRISIQFFEIINKWFKGNFLSLNLENFIHFPTKNSQSIGMKIGYGDKMVPDIFQTKFIGVTIDSMLSWRTQIEQLISTLNTACYVIRFIKLRVSQTTVIMTYYSLLHSRMNCRLMFWGNSS
jgi:hypothetical protein